MVSYRINRNRVWRAHTVAGRWRQTACGRSRLSPWCPTGPGAGGPSAPAPAPPAGGSSFTRSGKVSLGIRIHWIRIQAFCSIRIYAFWWIRITDPCILLNPGTNSFFLHESRSMHFAEYGSGSIHLAKSGSMHFAESGSMHFAESRSESMHFVESRSINLSEFGSMHLAESGSMHFADSRFTLLDESGPMHFAESGSGSMHEYFPSKNDRLWGYFDLVSIYIYQLLVPVPGNLTATQKTGL